MAGGFEFELGRPPTPDDDRHPDMCIAGEAFRALDLRAQMCILRPYLHLIMREEYEPAQWRNEAFYKRLGTHDPRWFVCTDGIVTENEKFESIAPQLLRWALREERWRGHMDGAVRDLIGTTISA